MGSKTHWNPNLLVIMIISAYKGDAVGKHHIIPDYCVASDIGKFAQVTIPAYYHPVPFSYPGIGTCMKSLTYPVFSPYCLQKNQIPYLFQVLNEYSNHHFLAVIVTKSIS